MSQFLKPLTIEEAVRMKSEYAGSLYLGGGTENNNPESLSHGEVYISLEKLNLKACVRGNHNTILGASATFQELIDWEESFPALREAAGFISSRNVRNQATLGGNIGAALEDSYLIPLLLAWDADVEQGNEEIVPLEQYLKEKRQNLIINVRFANGEGRTAVKNITRSSAGLSALNAAVCIKAEKGVISEAAVAVGGMQGVARRLPAVEEGLRSGALRPGGGLEEAVSAAVDFQNDLKGTAEYKEYLCGTVISELVSRCMEASA